jgi:hypothetical protein
MNAQPEMVNVSEPRAMNAPSAFATELLLVMETLPFVAVAALHVSRHAAWLRMPGTSVAVPAFVVGPTVVVLIVLAMAGLAACLKQPTARVTLW